MVVLPCEKNFLAHTRMLLILISNTHVCKLGIDYFHGSLVRVPPSSFKALTKCYPWFNCTTRCTAKKFIKSSTGYVRRCWK